MIARFRSEVTYSHTKYQDHKREPWKMTLDPGSQYKSCFRALCPRWLSWHRNLSLVLTETKNEAFWLTWKTCIALRCTMENSQKIIFKINKTSKSPDAFCNLIEKKTIKFFRKFPLWFLVVMWDELGFKFSLLSHTYQSL